MKQIAPSSMRLLMFAVIVLAVMAFSAFCVTPVFADGDSPLPPESPADVVPPTEGTGDGTQAETESPPKVDSVPEAGLPPEEVVPGSQPEAVSSLQAEAMPDVFEQTPSDTDGTTLNVQGEPLPLEGEDAADIIASSDPWWCPGTGKPLSAVDGRCTTGPGSGAQANFADLIAWMIPNANTDGTIWIYDYDSSLDGDVSFDGNAFNVNVQRGSLTLNGGWNGVPNGTGLLNPADYVVFDGISLSIFNWIGPVTLNNTSDVKSKSS